MGPGTHPTGQGRTPPDAGQRPGRARPGRLPAGKQPLGAHGAGNKIVRTMWALLAHERGYRGDYASARASRTLGSLRPGAGFQPALPGSRALEKPLAPT